MLFFDREKSDDVWIALFNTSGVWATGVGAWNLCRLQEVLPNHKFEFILATSEYMYRKPHRRIFEFALQKAELKPEEVWYIGDNYECDIEGAKNAGLFPVWYLGATEKPQEPKEGILTVKSWEEVKALLK
jgi:putative hydrolase of the HAD superfamily